VTHFIVNRQKAEIRSPPWLVDSRSITCYLFGNETTEFGRARLDEVKKPPDSAILACPPLFWRASAVQHLLAEKCDDGGFCVYTANEVDSFKREIHAIRISTHIGMIYAMSRYYSRWATFAEQTVTDFIVDFLSDVFPLEQSP
jgi:hypothetical protein